MIPVIMSGGAGSRLWPVSRQLDPKPFIKLADGLSLLQNTFLRATKLQNVTSIVTVTSEQLQFRMEEEYKQVNTTGINCDFILEPYGRNTAPAIAAACLFIAQNYSPDECILILPADHLISEQHKFNQAVDAAVAIANQGFIVTFGIHPEYPETGYGYIEFNPQQKIGEGGYAINRFIEKPNLINAQKYLAAEDYLWNAGLFCGKVNTFLEQFNLHAPKLLQATKHCVLGSTTEIIHTNKICHLNDKTFKLVENISIDYALFEKSSKIAVVPCSIGWSDIGSWLSIAQTLPKDKNNNAIIGETILHNTTDCLIYSTDRIIAGVDISNLVIVDTPDAVLVATKNYAQNVKFIFERLKKMNHQTSESHQTVHQPWGTYTILDNTSLSTIRRIEINPHSTITWYFNADNHNEHVVVLGGTAVCMTATQQFSLTPNQSMDIMKHTAYTITNTTDDILSLLEIQSGKDISIEDMIKYNE